MEDKLFTLLVEQEDITWKDILYDLVKTEELDPWDVDVGKLTKRYIETLREFKKSDFKVSGKVVLAAALLLHIKGDRLVGEDLDALDRLLSQKDMTEEEFYNQLENAEFRDPSRIPESERIQLIPRTPQPRLRRVSVYDLVAALEKALEVKKRRILRELPAAEVFLPHQKQDITLVIKGMYKHILEWFSKHSERRLFFSTLTPNATKEDKVFTFIPLLHLTNERKIDLHQSEHFGDIRIDLIDKEKVRGPGVKKEEEYEPVHPHEEAKKMDKERRKKERSLKRNGKKSEEKNQKKPH